MQAPQIKLEIARIVPHMPLCKSLRKEEPGECNCSHDATVEELNTMVYRILKGLL